MSFDQIKIPAPREIFINELKERIIKGKLVVGEKLPTERELEAQTGISKSVIHFSLKELERKGFINIISRQGAFVADYARTGSLETLNEILRFNDGRLSYKMSLELVELRNSVEGRAIINLSKFYTAEDISMLCSYIDELNDAITKNAELSRLAEVTSNFHYQICVLSRNHILTMMMNTISPMTSVLWENFVEFWGPECLVEQEKKIVKMIQQHDGHEAQKYIDDIFAQFLDAYVESEQRQNENCLI